MFQYALGQNNLSLKEEDIVIITSKAVSYAEGRLVDTDHLSVLVRNESDRVFGEGEMVMTLKNKMLIPNAGIDKSNAPEGKAILWPKNPFQSARDLCQSLKHQFGLTRLGVLISDSNLHPLRRGTIGMAIGWAGFEGVQDERGNKDLFGKTLHYSQHAVADNLSSAAEPVMGNGDASIPFVLVRGSGVTFSDREFSAEDYFMDTNDCLYSNIMDLGEN